VLPMLCLRPVLARQSWHDARSACPPQGTAAAVAAAGRLGSGAASEQQPRGRAQQPQLLLSKATLLSEATLLSKAALRSKANPRDPGSTEHTGRATKVIASQAEVAQLRRKQVSPELSCHAPVVRPVDEPARSTGGGGLRRLILT
jgi:hypothetical protein